jgi:hypothetical protein
MLQAKRIRPAPSSKPKQRGGSFRAAPRAPGPPSRCASAGRARPRFTAFRGKRGARSALIQIRSSARGLTQVSSHILAMFRASGHHHPVAIEDSLFRDVPYGLILGLYPEDRGWKFWQVSHDTECLNAMSQIESGHMVGFLPYLAPLLFRPSPVRENAARTLAHLFRTDLPRSLTFLSQGLGRSVDYETRAADELRQISAQSTRALDVPCDHAWAAFGLLSFHGSGWVRQAAVEKLAEVAGGLEIPFLLYRAND